MSKKIKGIVISGASALILIIAAVLGINISSDKDERQAVSSDVPVTAATTSAVPVDIDEVVTTAQAKKPAKTTNPNPVTTVRTTVPAVTDVSYVEYHFRNEKLLDDHFNKHGMEFKVDFGYETAEEYERGASNVINNPDALYKTEAEDGDGIYYIEETNEFVVLSTDGYIRTYFRPGGRKDYFDRQ